MKNLFLLILCFKIFNAGAQKRIINNIDSVYHFIETGKHSSKESTWEIGITPPYKYFLIKCQCLHANEELMFVYRSKEPGQVINGQSFDKIDKRNFKTLINLARKTYNLTASTLYIYFFIEKMNEDKYVVHQVRLLMPQKQTVTDAIVPRLE